MGAVVFTAGWLTGAERARACPGFPAHTGGLGDCSSIELGLGVSPANSGADHFSLTREAPMVAIPDGPRSGDNADAVIDDGFTKVEDLPDNIKNHPKLPGYVTDGVDTATRDEIRSVVQDTGDIAQAGELLAQFGNLTYDQTTAEGNKDLAKEITGKDDPETSDLSNLIGSHFIGAAKGEDAQYASRGACFDFIHMAGMYAGDAGGVPLSYGGGLADLIDPETMVEWDGESEIPRGKIVIGTARSGVGGQDSYGFYHVGISMGQGWVVSSHGSGPQVEETDDVFGTFYTNPITGRGVYYGDYKPYDKTKYKGGKVLPKQASTVKPNIPSDRVTQDFNATVNQNLPAPSGE